MVRPLSCSPEVLGKSYLKADLSVECGTPEHRAHVLLAVLVLLVFCAGLPLGTMSVMAWKRRHGHLASDSKARPDAVMQALSFMSVDYREQRYDGDARSHVGCAVLLTRVRALVCWGTGSTGRVCCC